MLTDYKGRPLVPWVKLLTQTLQIIAEAAEPEETQEAIKAAWIRYTTGQESEFKGIKKVIYDSLCSTIDSSADSTELKRIGGRKGGLARSSIAKDSLSIAKDSPRDTEYREDLDLECETDTETDTETDDYSLPGSGSGSAALSLEDLEKSCRRNHIKLSGSQLKQLYEQLKENDFTIGGQYIKDLGKVLRWYEKNPDAIVGPQFPEDDDYVTGIIEW